MLYKTDIPMVSEVIHSFFRGKSESRKLFLIDNSPTNELISLTDLYPGRISYHFANENLGYGKAHNIGIRKSMEEGFKYHVVLNPDLSFREDTIPVLEAFMDENDDVGLCMPDIRNMNDNSRRYCARLLPTPKNGIFRFLMGNSRIATKIDDEYQLRHADFTKIMNVPYLSGCFMFFRNDVFRYVGMFDERFFMYYEDVDLSRRFHEVGRTCYVPMVTANHIAERASYKSKKMLWIMIKSAFQYFNKYGWFFDRQGVEMNNKAINQLLNKKC